MAAETRVDLQVNVKGLSQLYQAAEAMEDVEKAARKLNGSLPKTERGLKGSGSAARKASGGFKALGASVAAALGPIIGITSAIAFMGKGLNAAFERGNAEQRFANITSSTREYETALALATQASDKFGMSQTEATSALADVYSRVQGLGFGLKETNEIFTGFNTLARKAGISAEEASRAFTQMSQALGKGKLNGDELASKLETFPQLLTAVAKTMKVPTSEIQKLGSEGKITSEILYQTLAEAAKGADNLGDSLTPLQKAFSDLSGNVQNAFVELGKMLEPVVIPALKAMNWVTQEVAKYWEYLNEVVFPKVAEAIKPVTDEFKKIVEQIDWQYLKRVLSDAFVKTMEVAIVVLRKVSEIFGWIVGKFRELASSPIAQALIGTMGKLVNLLGLGAGKVDEFAEKQKKATEEAASAVDEFSSLPDKIEDSKEKTKELAKAAREVTRQINAAAAAADRRANAQGSIAELENELAQQQITTEKALNQVLLDQAQTRLENAQTDQQRIRAATDIYNLTIAQARLDQEAAKAQVAAAVEKSRVAVENLQLKLRELQAVVALAEAEGTVTKEHYKALQLQQEAVTLAEQQYSLRQQIAVEQNKEIDALFMAQQNAAKLAYQQNIVADNTASAASSAAQFAGNMSQAASSAQQAAQAMQNVDATSAALGSVAPGMQTTTGGGGRGYNFGSAMSDESFASDWEKANKNFKKRVQNNAFSSARDADEEFDKVIASFRRRADKINSKQSVTSSGQQSGGNSYGGGSSGATGGTPSVNITTGPLLNMDGQNYVTQEDFVVGLQTAVEEGARTALSAISSGGGSRRELGVG